MYGGASGNSGTDALALDMYRVRGVYLAILSIKQRRMFCYRVLILTQ